MSGLRERLPTSGRVLRLSDLVGAPVRSADGRRLGRLTELTIGFGPRQPPLRRLVVRPAGRRTDQRLAVDWSEVVALAPGDVRVQESEPDRWDADPDELLLIRDVLDTQVLDVGGKRLARVAEVYLTHDTGNVSVVGVDIGAAAIWRRLGLKRLASRSRSSVLEWSDLHPISARGHALALSGDGAGVQRLSPAELAALVTHLPLRQGAEVLTAVAPETAAEALTLTPRRVGTEMLAALPENAVTAIASVLPEQHLGRLTDLRFLSRRAGGKLFAGVRRPHRRHHGRHE
ncbi:MAG: hypothetical protein WCB04_10360 [Mycobacteriales bacterium]